MLKRIHVCFKKAGMNQSLTGALVTGIPQFFQYTPPLEGSIKLLLVNRFNVSSFICIAIKT